ncbi:MAG: hypothetical protein E7645_00345 [Ruminococcaceae bacterium]|nr:hypothetical protein [Oscillospiraceae bacterium]
MMYANDRVLSVAALMSHMSEDLITESDIRGGAFRSVKPQRRGRFLAFVNHPAMVAALCTFISIGIVAVILLNRGEYTRPPVSESIPAESETQEDTYPEQISADFDSYESILMMYRKMVELSPEWMKDDEQAKVDAQFAFPDSIARHWYMAMSISIAAFYPQNDMLECDPAGHLHFGYAIKDINRDGVDELFLLTKDMTIVAIFTLRADDRPVLLETFGNKHTGFVNDNGQLMVVDSYSDPPRGERSIYRMDAATRQLVFEESLAIVGQNTEGNVLYYYRTADEAYYISEEVYDLRLNGIPFATFGQNTFNQSLRSYYAPIWPMERLFFTHEDIIRVFRHLMSEEPADAPENEKIQVTNENDDAIYRALKAHADTYRGKDVNYIIADVNLDGEDELLLLSSNTRVFALFSMAYGIPIDTGYEAKDETYFGYLPAYGAVCHTYGGKDDHLYIRVQKLVSGQLVTVHEFGTFDKDLTDDSDPVAYYMVANEERHEISYDDFMAMYDALGVGTFQSYLANGYTLFPLFPGGEVFTDEPF